MTNLIGVEVYYKGDNANCPYFGTITNDDGNYLTVTDEEGQVHKGFFKISLGDKYTDQLVTKESYLKYREEQLANLKKILLNNI